MVWRTDPRSRRVTRHDASPDIWRALAALSPSYVWFRGPDPDRRCGRPGSFPARGWRPARVARPDCVNQALTQDFNGQQIGSKNPLRKRVAPGTFVERPGVAS
jgi:hypothetical protein